MEIMGQAMHHPDVAKICREAKLHVPDGIGALKILRKFGFKPEDRITGVDLGPKILELAPVGTKVFFFGAPRGVADSAMARFAEIYKNIDFVGADHGYDVSDKELFAKINASGATILYVALGVPKQERWTAKNLPNMPGIKLAMGVGGSFQCWADPQGKNARLDSKNESRMGSQGSKRASSQDSKILENPQKLPADVFLWEMKTVTLWGYYGYGNVGDEAILASMLNLLGDVKVNLISGPIPSVEESGNLKIIPRSIKRLISSISKSNGFVLGGGGLVHDRINAKSTWYHLLGPSFSRFSNKPVAAIGQQIGPFYRNFTKKLVRYSLSRATLTVRDQKSFNEAKSLGLNPILSADMAFLLKPDEPSKEIAEKIKKLPKPVIVFAPGIDPRWTPTPERSSKILEHLQKQTGGSVLFYHSSLSATTNTSKKY